ncbi:MAG: IreB family regulatory phosphoprotein [Bacilli bacterium]
MNPIEQTQKFKIQNKDYDVKGILVEVYDALEEKGYNPINQIVGYLISGDPTYISNHKNARNVIQQLDQEEILEELVKKYIDNEK